MEPLQQDKTTTPTCYLQEGVTGLPSSSSQPTTFLLKKWKLFGIEECIVLKKELHSVGKWGKEMALQVCFDATFSKETSPDPPTDWLDSRGQAKERRRDKNLHDILKTHWTRYQKCLKPWQYKAAPRHLFFGMRIVKNFCNISHLFSRSKLSLAIRITQSICKEILVVIVSTLVQHHTLAYCHAQDIQPTIASTIKCHFSQIPLSSCSGQPNPKRAQKPNMPAVLQQNTQLVWHRHPSLWGSSQEMLWLQISKNLKHPNRSDTD